jgi:hypothetical protein
MSLHFMQATQALLLAVDITDCIWCRLVLKASAK